MRTVTTTDHLKCIFAKFIYGVNCTLCRKIYIGLTPGRRLGADRLREHFTDVEINDKDASKPVERHFYLSKETVCCVGGKVKH